MGDVVFTERFILSHIQKSDTQLIYDIFTDPICIKFIGDRGIRSLDDAKAVWDYENLRHDLTEILAYTDPENLASQKVLEKLGMQRNNTITRARF